MTWTETETISNHDAIYIVEALNAILAEENEDAPQPKGQVKKKFRMSGPAVLNDEW